MFTICIHDYLKRSISDAKKKNLSKEIGKKYLLLHTHTHTTTVQLATICRSNAAAAAAVPAMQMATHNTVSLSQMRDDSR